MTPVEKTQGLQRARLALAITTALAAGSACAGESLDAEFLEFLAQEAQDSAQTRQDPELVAWLRDWWNPDSKTAVAAERTEEKP